MKDIVLKDLLSLIPFNTEIFIVNYHAPKGTWLATPL